MTTKITEKNISNVANMSVQWQSVHVADGSTALTATSGKGYFIDTTSGTQTVNIPSLDDSTLGDTIMLKDFARNWGTNAVTLGSNTFDGVAGNTPTFNVTGQTVTLVFMGNTKGWSLINEDTTNSLGAEYISATGGTVSEVGDFKIHTFTGDGCFVVSSLGNDAGGGTSVEYLVVAGGGGGARDNAGGGGAGGVRFFAGPDIPVPSYPAGPRNGPAAITATVSTFPVTVGAGGGPGNTPGSGACAPGQRGSNSVFSTITSTGGGGSNGDGQPTSPKMPGGSGGGEGQGAGTKGTGNTPPVSPSQGSDGGTNGANPGGGGGGGGFMAVGSNNSGDTGGAGGVGGGFPTAFVGCNGVPSSCHL